MPSHFSSIGFPVASQEELVDLANRVADDVEELDVPAGCYLRWSSACGAELWLQVDRDNDLIGMNPHFAGESSVRVGITARVDRSDCTPLDGAFHGWADPAEDDPQQGSYPFVFDLPDACLHAELALPAIVPVQIAAFAHEVSIFGSEEEYYASQPDEPRFASQSFIPSGLFTPGGDATVPPQAYAIFTGHVLRAERRTNDLTGRPFFWALVDTLGGIFDVVVDPELLPEPPSAGGILSGSFWLSGRLL
jgi:hypothetical protein